ncbi:hypothetical protein [Desulforamulus hydrothermalis]|uniref:Uncharacterized protein n=1 Tax=Desulforamulus hydrothermalis Lam5 = DSM 18033 TaxID=1121428 RepID=K8EF89_9FIRM|nr:hypothetical protein [Desulforamulus hydrothermalis]CCO07361.1 conserved hypothetical protein [Desulforamulus hydrothermalis Lam5 = DSM 18033]SHG94877.1 hypothetical protein SAMN02745177_00905 [Desulforamulus hydrothermalis Lam5 = DSM 18033]
MFFRKITTKKNGKEYVYVKLIENYRQDGKVKQRVIANFGSVDNLSAERIKYLIASLRKLHNEIETQAKEPGLSLSLNITSQIHEVKKQINNSPLKEALFRLFGEANYGLAEALIVKAITAAEIDKPVQEVCQNLGLTAATSLQFYNAMKLLGQDRTKGVLLSTRLFDAGGNDNIHKVGVIHLFKAVFEGNSFEVDMTGNIFMPQNYRKEIFALIACDCCGVPVDFEYADEWRDVPAQLQTLVKRLRNKTAARFIVLDETNMLADTSLPVAKVAAEVPGEIQNALKKGSVKHGNRLFFQVTRFSQLSEGKIKELQAKLARVSAGLETIKADVLLGKLTRETQIRKKADNVIKSNQCEDLVTYSYNDNDQVFNYYINEENLKQKKQTKHTTAWVIDRWPEPGLDYGLTVNTDRFRNLTDQLKIPPINLYVDYHYSPEIISGHLQLEMIKTQILNAMNTPYQGGEM